MIFKGIFRISQNIRKYKLLCVRAFSYSTSQKHFLSTGPVDLSFSKFQPDSVSNLPPIIILHGFLGSKQNWRGLSKAIAMKSGRQVYVLDARNHGDSPHSEYFSYNIMCEDVKYFMNVQAISSAVLVGHSMGGRTAMKLALTEKQMVDKLVVVDVSPIKMPESSASTIPGYLTAMMEAVASAHNLGLVKARKVIDDYLAQSIQEVAVRQFLLTNLAEKDGKVIWKANIDTLQKTFHSEVYESSKLTGYYLQETLFICGGESPYVKEEDYPQIKELFPQAKFIKVPGAGHWVHSEKPSDFLEALCNFI